jgi:hypothetical protein
MGAHRLSNAASAGPLNVVVWPIRQLLRDQALDVRQLHVEKEAVHVW